MDVTIIGAGVAGLCCAVELAERGADVEVLERSERLGANSCSWYAGGMLAPWCERETAEPLVAELGRRRPRMVGRPFSRPGAQWQPGDRAWSRSRRAHPLCSSHRALSSSWIAPRSARSSRISPTASSKRCCFRDEAHLDPRAALASLIASARDRSVRRIRFGTDAAQVRLTSDK